LVPARPGYGREDTSVPPGPVLVTGLDHDDLLVQFRLNDDVKQSQRPTDCIVNIAAVAGDASRFVLLRTAYRFDTSAAP
jgi:hypothetical protein